jgi:hypothetical protein
MRVGMPIQIQSTRGKRQNQTAEIKDQKDDPKQDDHDTKVKRRDLRKEKRRILENVIEHGGIK